MSLPRLSPLTLGVIKEPFSHADWVYEMKYDGYRALLYLDQGKVDLVSRNGKHYTRLEDFKRELGEELGRKARTAIIDGEIVCLDGQGRSVFNAIPKRKNLVFVAFDLLWFQDEDRRDLSLLYRKSLLSSIVPTRGTGTCAMESQYVLEHGERLYQEVCAIDCEGVVAKLAQSKYELLPGKRSPWLKVKNPDYTQGIGRAELFNRKR